jgi:hypothetical protein
MSRLRQAAVIAAILVTYGVSTGFKSALPLSVGLAVIVLKWETKANRPEPTKAVAMSSAR